jgi:hypothetical protein
VTDAQVSGRLLLEGLDLQTRLRSARGPLALAPVE